MAQNLEENSVSIVIFGSDENIGEVRPLKAYRQGRVCTCRRRHGFGRVVNALGQ